MGTFALLMALAAVAIPIVIVAKIVRRLREASSRFMDPARLQRVFAQSAAAALRRAGGDHHAIAKLEGLGQGRAADDHGADRRAALPAAIDEPGLRTVERPRAAIGHALHRQPRLRPRHEPLAPLGGVDLGDRFRLSEPPDIGEPHGPTAFNANWLAVAALLGAAAYYFLR